ncbi:MAG: hypothetical protein RIR70_1104 [Pseudomonadota bacterium]|jgi:peptidoglycan/xylan/chitin deacetylase (PgdA/CDA1 family)
MRRAVRLLLGSWLCSLTLAAGAQSACKGTVYLTIDTGSMSHAELIAETLNKHQVKATFFLANEKTVKGFDSLNDFWTQYWRERAAEGHAFGSHTFDHGYFRRDIKGGLVSYEVPGKPARLLDARGVCDELNRAKTAFRTMTGREFDPIWRAPGGRTTPNALKFAKQCGYQHVGWTESGFLGDELPSDTYPNDTLLKRALASIRDGDILMMHTGIWSRKEPFAPMLDPLIAGLKARGLCFAKITERK